MSSPSDSLQCNILRHQEMHTGTPEYKAYRHQGAVKNYPALRRVFLKVSALKSVSVLKFNLSFLFQFAAYLTAFRNVSLSLFSLK